MDIRNISNKANVERSTDRGRRAEGKRAESAPAVVRDEASISPNGRATASAVEALAERARGDDGDRAALVANAMRKLLSGEIDSTESIEGAARRLRDSRFGTA